jgi:predicted alpha/beta hydrolase family esterase
MSAIITLPGIGGSPETHWQAIWERGDPSIVRFEPSDWNNPDLDDWIAALDRAVDAAAEPPILVAHSLACLLAPHWAARRPLRPVRGAFLVAVPDPDAPSFPAVEAASFRGVPETILPFPALVVASTDDPYGSIGYARGRAAAWGAGFVAAGALGHINGASALGDWPLGAMLFEAFRAGTVRR